MPTSPRPDRTPQKNVPLPPTLSDARLPHPARGPAGAAGVVLSAGQRPLPEYELVRLLGRGGFGEVWQAKGPGGFDVALKFVRLGEKVGEAELRALELMKGVRHAYLLTLFGAWQRDGFLIVAMELADGTLLGRLRQAQEQGRAGIPGKELLEHMREAAKGLDFLNEAGGGEGAGIQHKDIKPQNLLVVGGTVKVADFGLARVLEQTVTEASGSLTPAYAAPEFFKGKVTRWSDQYSLAVSYCQLRGGRLPFGGNAVQVMAGHLTQAPELDMLPAAERPAVARALAKGPEERWPSCRAFVAGLQAPRREGPAATATHPAPATPSATAPAVVPQRPAKLERLRRLLPWLLAPLALLGPVAVVLGVFWLSGGLSPRKDRQAQKVEKSAGTPGEEPVAPAPAPAPDKGKENPKKEGPVAQPPADGKPKEGEPFTNTVGMKFVWVKPGTFRMGSPPGEEKRYDDEAPHRVTLTRGFHLGAHLVTQRQWEQVMGKDANRSHFMGKDDEEKGRLPVDNVSWKDCREFCRKLGELEGRRYRLPWEAEWEYACRAGATTAFWWGGGITTDQANYDGNYTYGTGGRRGEYRQKTTPVDFFPANPWGLHDMHGNLWQWCEDAYGPYGEGDKTDPFISGKDEDARVQRGGSWGCYPRLCRAADRRKFAPGDRRGGYGCRVVLCLSGGPAPRGGGLTRGAEGQPKGPVSAPPDIVKPVQAPRPKEGEPFTNSVGMKFVWVRPGTFRMGSPPREEKRDADETPRRVKLTKGYHLGVHLVTQHQWERVMGKEANRSHFMGKDEDEKKRLPVDNVSWNDCQEFCLKLGALEGRRYRLPTEAEWEYACRAGTNTAFWWGAGITTDQANYDGNYTYGAGGKKGEYRQKTTPVGFFKANPWGLYDMHSNLWQWCEDAYGPYGEGDKINPLNMGKAADARVLRGGSWCNTPRLCRAAVRDRRAPGIRRELCGCRVVLSEPVVPAPPPAPDEDKQNPKPKDELPKEPVAPPPAKPPAAPRPREGEPFTNSVGMKFVWIRPGTFRMGSPPGEEKRDNDETLHRVTLTKGFHLGAHLVTQRQWERVLGKDANTSWFMGKDEDEKKRLPVDNVSWNDCQEFCRRLGALEGRRYRLPTEAEWEYACRAGTTTPFWWGGGITTDQANYDGNYTYGTGGRKWAYRQKPTPVDLFKANPWGLHDMHGNLWQWCEDAYGPYGDGDKTNPLNTGKVDDARVLRGGSWITDPGDCRAASRGWRAPALRPRFCGCRVVLCLD